MSSNSEAPPEVPGVQVIHTKRLILRRLHASDAPYLLPIVSNSESMEWLGGMQTKTIQETQDWIDERLARPGIDSFLVELLPTTQTTTAGESSGEFVREVIGITGSAGIPGVGFIYHPRYFGKGYAREALEAYMESYWNRIPPVSSGKPGSFDFASATTDVENLSSRRLLEKYGFVFRRISEERYDNPLKGGLRDHAFYVIPRPGMNVNEACIPWETS